MTGCFRSCTDCKFYQFPIVPVRVAENVPEECWEGSGKFQESFGEFRVIVAGRHLFKLADELLNVYRPYRQKAMLTQQAVKGRVRGDLFPRASAKGSF